MVSILFMIFSAHWTEAAINLSERGLPCGPPNRSSAVCMCRLAKIAAIIPITRLRLSSIAVALAPFAFDSPSICATLVRQMGLRLLMAMHSLAYRIFTFFLSMVVSAGVVAVGSIIAFWPATYMRWLRWSNVHRYAPWVLRGRDLSQNQYGWQFRTPGIRLHFSVLLQPP